MEYLLLWSAHGSSKGRNFQQSVYDTVPSSQCGQSDLFEDNAQLMQLKMVHQHHSSVQDATRSLHVETI